MVLERWINVFALQVYKNNLCSHKDIRKMRYAMLVIGGEISKILIMLAFFSLIGKVQLFMFSLVSLLILRTYSGGVHLKTSFGCLCVSLAFFICTVMLLPLLPIHNQMVYLGMAVLSLLIIAIRSPILSIYRPIRNKKRKQKVKITSIFLAGIYICILFLFIKDPVLFRCGIWTIVLQSLQLLL